MTVLDIDYEYVLYIDEAGDVGTKAFDTGTKSTAWFGVGGYVISKKYEPDAAEWIRQIRTGSMAPPSAELHYKGLDERRRIGVAREVAKLPLRAFMVLSHKENMRGYENPRAAKAGGENVFYNFCLRVLLERVTEAVARSSLKRFDRPAKMKIVIAQTGGVRYGQTAAYLELLRLQAVAGTTFLSAATINPKVVDMWLVEQISAKNSAACQIADTIVSSFYNAVNDTGKYPKLQEPARALWPVVGRHYQRRSNVGLTLLPWNRKIPIEDRPIFETYGYGWAPWE